MKKNNRFAKWMQRRGVELLVATLLVSQVTPMTTVVYATEDISVEKGTNEQQEAGEEQTTEQATEEMTEEAMQEQTTEQITEEMTEEATEEQTTEQITEEVATEITTEQATEEVTEEVTTEQATEEVTQEVTIEQATEGMTEEPTIELTIEEMMEEAVKEVELEERVINMPINGVLITVCGVMPADAYLEVTALQIEADVKQEIVRMSDRVKSMKDLDTAQLLYSYDISILSQGEEYEPYLHEEEVEVRFTYMTRNALQEVDYIEVFHVSEQDGVERVEVTSVSDYEVVMKADEFSQYIVIGQVDHSYETQWDFGYQEYVQNFEAPVKGIYKIELLGAQGGHYGEYQGGLGGMVTAYVELEKNQIIEMITGGQNGFHGGNHGTVSNGGGATELRIAGELVAVAGGGGGAGIQGEGGRGGLSTEMQELEKTSRGIVSESFGGGAGYQNGQDGYVLLHEHIGNASEGGGCYTKTNYIYHNHKTSGCKYVQRRCTSTSYIGEGWWPQVQGENPCEHVICRECAAKHTGPRDGSAGYDYNSQCGSVLSQYWGCGKTENALDGVEFALGCEKDETTVDGMVASAGGSNFYQAQICKNVATAAGANEGDGRAVITLVEMDAATIYYYKSASELLTSVSVERGTMAAYPVSEEPQKEADSKYSYTFIGWDDMATQEEEKLQAQATVENVVVQDRSYMAVYDKTPRSYMVTFWQETAEVIGTQRAAVQYGTSLPVITIPQKKDYIFAGYYTGLEGSGTRIYREDGTGEQISHFEQDVTLYPYWIAPLAIIKEPNDVTVQTGYPFAVMETQAILTPTSGYGLSYQWYISTQKDGNNASKIDGAVGNRCTIPTGYQVGNYYIYCEITAISAFNGQQIIKTTQPATFMVEKGNLSQSQLRLKTSQVIYDGKSHSTALDMQVQSEVQVYYSEVLLTRDNYQEKGSTVPLTYTKAGTYPVYVYVTSANYQDYMGMVTLTIEKAEPLICLSNRNVAYNRKQQGIGDAMVYGINQESLNASVEYVYYIDEECSTLTSKTNGASQDGGKPSKIGTYYVQASVKETDNYKGVSLSQPAMLNIIATKSKFHVSGYHGVYDAKAHGVQIEIGDEEATTFWFSDETELTKENYQQAGTKTPYMYSKPGTYQVYYMAVTKITGWIYDYTSGSVKIVIEPASTNQDNGNGGHIQGEWIPDTEIPLQPGVMSEEEKKENVQEVENDRKTNHKVITVNKTNTTTDKEAEGTITSTMLSEAEDKMLGQDSTLLLLMDCLDKLTPQEVELLRSYLDELYPGMEEQEEEIEQEEKVEEDKKTIVVTGVLGMFLGVIIGMSMMFMLYPVIHQLLMKRCCVKGKCTERAQHMKVLLETKKGIQQIEKRKNGTFCLPKLQKGETYLLKGTIRNGKTLVLMRIQPQTWHIHYECTEIAGLQIQVKERRGGLKITIQ